MYLIRDVLNCKPGKVGELRKMFKALNGVMERTAFKRFPLITDVCGAPFWTFRGGNRNRKPGRFRRSKTEKGESRVCRTVRNWDAPYGCTASPIGERLLPGAGR
jgi:hypothetical protein